MKYLAFMMILISAGCVDDKPIQAGICMFASMAVYALLEKRDAHRPKRTSQAKSSK